MAIKPSAITPGANHSGVENWWGFSVQEDASAAVSWEFRKAAVDGDVVWYLKLAAGESASIVFPQSISMEGGVYIKEVSGSATGVLLGD